MTTATERVKSRLRFGMNVLRIVGIGAFITSVWLWLLGVQKPFGAGLLVGLAALIAVAVAVTLTNCWKALAADKIEEFEFWFISVLAVLIGGVLLVTINAAFLAGW